MSGLPHSAEQNKDRRGTSLEQWFFSDYNSLSLPHGCDPNIGDRDKWIL
jgi:hypothetical protein